MQAAALVLLTTVPQPGTSWRRQPSAPGPLLGDSHWEVVESPPASDKACDLPVQKAANFVLPVLMLATGLAPHGKGLQCAWHCSTGYTCIE